MPQGLDLEISHHPLTMRRVVNLVVAMERLKASKSEFSCSTEFRDEDLLNMIVESAMEGRQTSAHRVSSCQLSSRLTYMVLAQILCFLKGEKSIGFQLFSFSLLSFGNMSNIIDCVI